MASQIFTGYRVLGLITNDVPLCMRYIKSRREYLIVTCVGRSFHTYGAKNLKLLSVSPPQENEITSMTVDSFHVYTAHGKEIYAWRRGHELQHRYSGHEYDVHLMLTFGPHLISIDSGNVLKVWNIREENEYFNTSLEGFTISAIAHPYTYLDKVLLGSWEGTLQLWNLRTGQLVKSYDHNWKSRVMALTQAPAEDMMAVGLENGRIYLYNLKYEKPLFSLLQEYGPVTSLSARMDQPILASGSHEGHIVIWDLEKRAVAHQLLNAHTNAPVTGLQFLLNEPMLISSASDNALKMWLFDMPDGSGRLYSHRSGHALPPTYIRYHALSGEFILSADKNSSLHMLSTVGDNLHKCLGQALLNKKSAKKMKRRGLPYDGTLAPITKLDSASQREKEWDNVICLHHHSTLATLWSTNRGTMGNHKIDFPHPDKPLDAEALSVAVTECGNFAVIGYSTGHLDKFNIQSGLHRGTFGGKDDENAKAHDGPIRGVCVDAYNQVVISGGSDCYLKFWIFKTLALWNTLKLDASVAHMIFHRLSGLLAVALDNFDVIIVDMENKKVVRKFEGHTRKINDMAFSPDARWLITSSMDMTIRVWNLPSACLIDCFLTEGACTSLTFSPTADFLATSHVEDNGVYLWVNTTLLQDTPLMPLPKDHVPKLLKIEAINYTGMEDTSGILAESEQEIPMDLDHWKTPEQIEDLITFSQVPGSRWKNLLHIDLIMERNRPKEPPKISKSAPFFLPVVSGLEPQIGTDASETDEKSSTKIFKSATPLTSDFIRLLERCALDKDYGPFFDKLFTMSPIALKSEIQYLSPLYGGSITIMAKFLEGLLQAITTYKNYDILMAYHACFIKTHGETIFSNKKLKDLVLAVEQEYEKTWPEIYQKHCEYICHNKYTC